MRQIIRTLASMKIAVPLLVLLLVALAAGTLVESRAGAAVAGHVVYQAIWFRLLLGLFALNVVCSLVDHWPWGVRRAGFALTHASMVIVLAGALVTDRFKVEGRLALWEGDESDRFATSEEGDTAPLPFRVKLEAFEIEYYPGTERPAMFRSRVVVTDPATRATFPAVIEMNRELSYAGYRLFQSSYQLGDGRDQTVLAVSHDPGQAIVFSGYILLMAGMMTVLFTRLAQRRAAMKQSPLAIRAHSAGRAAAILAALLLIPALPGSGTAAAAADPATVGTLRSLPVQHDGRVMPLDTVAREAVWKITGKSAWQDTDPTAAVLEWAFDDRTSAQQPILPVGPAFAAAAGLDAPGGRASFLGVVNNQRALALIEEARAMDRDGRPLPPILREAQKIEERLLFMQQILTRRIFRVVPVAGDPATAWTAPPRLDAAVDLLPFARAGIDAGQTDASRIATEIRYNRLRPSRLAWWILTAATLVSLAAWRRNGRFLDMAGVLGLAAGFAVMTWGIAARWSIAGRIPASNIYESLLFLAWGVALAGVAAFVFLRSRQIVLNASGMAALTMILADCLPIDPYIHPMPPVLSGTPWLAIHVPIIMVSYSLLALGVAVAHAQIGVTLFAPRRTELIAKLNDALYWYIHVGSFLLIAGILTGSIWAASSWGRYWGWDPKEVWSLIAFLAYLAILHGRFDRMIGFFGVAALSIVAFWTILMTYIGVNFVLAAGLHSYGFGASGVVQWMAIVAAAEAAFIIMGWSAHRAGRRREATAPA